MDLFTQRLKELSIMILFSIAMIVIALIPFGLIMLTGYIHENIPGIIMVSIVFGLIGFWVLKGLYWLLIEPFRKPKEEK